VSDQEGSATQQLLSNLRKGMVPRQVRLFAAKGLLPIPRDELLRFQVFLTADGDEELATAAASSVKEFEPQVLVEWLRSETLEPIELDLLVRVRDEEPIWAAVATHPKVSDETLRLLAKHATPLVQDIIITNQVRILDCLEILNDLRSNEQITTVISRRVREFEEEFIQKAAAGAEMEPEEEAPNLDEALQALKAIGGKLPNEEDLPVPEHEEDPALNDAVEKKGGSAFAKIITMSIKEKILCALKGGREERGILINSRNRLVINAVLSSPKITDNEIEKIANSKSVSDEAIRIIASNNRWLTQYGIKVALVHNPKTPAQTAVRLLNSLTKKDLVVLMRDRNAPEIVRRRAREINERLR